MLIINLEPAKSEDIEDWEIIAIETGLESLTEKRLYLAKKYLKDYDDFMVTYGDGVSNINLDLFVNINFYFALFNLLPLPGLDGMKLFFGSRSLYIFGVLFVILSMFLINYNLILGLIASFVISLIILTLYFKKWE